ncbi:MAG: dephospho-CoA kinase [Clostridia bacterium]|nr:dephospho-CoA kinase [Clostridia bacterium]
MYIIGITGPTGAGKSLFSEYLSQQNIPVIDADQVYHSLLIPPSPCLDALRRAFGDGILSPDGSLNRPALSHIVFHDEDKLALLNRTVLGFVLDQVREQIRGLERSGEVAVAIDAPTLIESGFHKECSVVISVLSSPKLRLERIVKRDSLSREAAEARIHAQKDDAFYREHSDFVLSNTDDRDTFFRACATLLRQLPIGSR